MSRPNKKRADLRVGEAPRNRQWWTIEKVGINEVVGKRIRIPDLHPGLERRPKKRMGRGFTHVR